MGAPVVEAEYIPYSTCKMFPTFLSQVFRSCSFWVLAKAISLEALEMCVFKKYFSKKKNRIAKMNKF